VAAVFALVVVRGHDKSRFGQYLRGRRSAVCYAERSILSVAALGVNRVGSA
jgi:hypothetical protein